MSVQADPNPELDWLPDSLDEVVTLRQRLLANGHSRHVVGLCIDWLVAIRAAHPVDGVGSPQRSKYRKMLRQLAEEPTPDDDHIINL